MDHPVVPSYHILNSSNCRELEDKLQKVKLQFEKAAIESKRYDTKMYFKDPDRCSILYIMIFLPQENE